MAEIYLSEEHLLSKQFEQAKVYPYQEEQVYQEFVKSATKETLV